MILICALKYNPSVSIGSTLKCDICGRRHPERHDWLYIEGVSGGEERWGKCCHTPPHLRDRKSCYHARNNFMSWEEMAKYWSYEYFEEGRFTTKEFWAMVRSGKFDQSLLGYGASCDQDLA